MEVTRATQEQHTSFKISQTGITESTPKKSEGVSENAKKQHEELMDTFNQNLSEVCIKL